MNTTINTSMNTTMNPTMNTMSTTMNTMNPTMNTVSTMNWGESNKGFQDALAWINQKKVCFYTAI